MFLPKQAPPVVRTVHGGSCARFGCAADEPLTVTQDFDIKFACKKFTADQAKRTTTMFLHDQRTGTYRSG